MREEGELQEAMAAEHRDNGDKEEFTYDSDPYDEAIDIGNWSNKRGSRSGGKAVEDSGEEEEFDSDDDSSGDDNNIIDNMDESGADEEEEEQEGEMESSNILQRREIEIEVQVAGGRRKAKRKTEDQ